MHEKRFSGNITRLRNPERVRRLEVARVVSLCLEGAEYASVLDAGMGTGLFAEEFARRGLAVSGVDVNPEMVVAAREFVSSGDFSQAEAEALPFLNSAFDLVFMGILLHESDEQLMVLREARRVARRRVGILEWAYREEEFGPPLAYRLNIEDFTDMASKAGFAKSETFPLAKLVLYRLSV